jgi:hypothetical protein
MGGAVAAGVQGVAVVAMGVLLGFLLGGSWGAVILGLVSVGFGVAYGRAVWLGRPYEDSPAGLRRCLIDATWSAPNTWAGAVYYGVLRLTGNPFEAERCRGKGSLWLTKGVFPHYATTVGPVKAGSSDRIDRHEEIHVFQARLLGPFYAPLVGLSYVVATILPYWLFVLRDRDRRPITSVRTYFENGVYPHTWHELWAYRATAPAPPTSGR